MPDDPRTQSHDDQDLRETVKMQFEFFKAVKLPMRTLLLKGISLLHVGKHLLSLQLKYIAHLVSSNLRKKQKILSLG